VVPGRCLLLRYLEPTAGAGANACCRYVHNKNKPAWQNIEDLVTGLIASGAPMHSDKVILALARYDTKPPRGPVAWWGKEGNTVQHAYDWIQAHRANASRSAHVL
jgi:hypothetical protein